HGWRHNADLCDRNVGAFRELLRKIYLDELQIIEATGLRRRPRPVVGVYVGWRGLSKKMWPFEQLSFVSRKNTAIRVGSGDMMGLLTRLERLRGELNAPGRDPSRLLIIGHSLGGTVVYTTLANVLKNRLAEAWPGVDPATGKSRMIRGFGDLIMLVN